MPKANPTTVTALTDTGCQSCLAGSNLLQKLGLTIPDLIPVTTKMRSANNEGIKILGALLLHISASDRHGRTLSSNQMTYVMDRPGTFFLSREACTDLGIIPKTFPTIGESLAISGLSFNAASFAPQAKGQATTAPEGATAPCGCPRRTAPLPLPRFPFPRTVSNRLWLQEYLLNYYKSSTFNTCPHQPLPHMSGPPMELMVDPEATPVAHNSPIPVALHFQEPVKAGLDMDVNLEVIENVPTGTPTEWCHRMVVCPKKDGKPRRTVDFQALNRHAKRETHHTPSPFNLARSIPQNMKKTTFDAWNGYHGLRLGSDASKALTTFITPWGRYRYKTAPQGYIASGDAYTKRYDAIIADVEDKVKCIDDTLLWSPDIVQSFSRAAHYLDLCGRNGIVLNPDKFVFAADEVEFAGFHITNTNVKPGDKFFRAISEFPTPASLTDVRSWFGLVNQVSYAFSMTKYMEPFRALLKSKSKFEWTDELEQTFQASKLSIVKEIENGVKIFDKSKPTCLATDWSKSGIGFWLFQKHCQCQGSKLFCCKTGWKITLVGSRFTHSAESRYAPVEGEALAVVYALDKARHFVLGCPNLSVAVDHKPLLKLFGDRSLEDIPNPRLRNLKEKTLRYRFSMIHVPGVKQCVADGLSRHPVDPAEMMDLPDDVAASSECSQFSSKDWTLDTPCPDIEKNILALASYTLQASPITSVTWDLVRTATTSDDTLHSLLELIEDGFSTPYSALPPNLQTYFPLREHLSTVDGIILYDERVLIPTSLRPNVLSTLHAAHQGISTMVARAESSVFWPGITNDIKRTREQCTSCNRIAPSHPSAPPTTPILPDYPFQCICADYFTYKGISYLVTVDRYSNWPIVEKSLDGAEGLISSLKQTFNTFGIPEELASDGGPEFTALSTQNFLRQWGVHHRLASVAYAHSNCQAELGVKTMKRLLMDNTGVNGKLNDDAFHRAILQYRNTPDRDTKLSPAMCVFGRQIRDFLPGLPSKYKPHQAWKDMLEARENALRCRHMKAHERLSEHTKRLPPLRTGDHVRIQNQTGPNPRKWDKTGTVVEVHQYDQYVIKVDGSNRTTLRNRKFLRKYIPARKVAPTRQISSDLIPPQCVPLQPVIPTPSLTVPPPGASLQAIAPYPTQLQVPAAPPPRGARPDETPRPSPDDAPAPRRSARPSHPPAHLSDFIR